MFNRHYNFGGYLWPNISYQKIVPWLSVFCIPFLLTSFQQQSASCYAKYFHQTFMQVTQHVLSAENILNQSSKKDHFKPTKKS
jgi:hypothetical protein